MDPKRSTHRPQPSPEDIGLERALEGLFRLAANRRFDTEQERAIGAAVTRAGYAVLRSLSDHGPRSLRELAAASVMDNATASRQVNQLVDAGLVTRRTADDDARAVVVALTPLGVEAYERIVRYRLAHLANVLADWSDDDRAVLSRLVGRLATDLGRTAPPEAPDATDPTDPTGRADERGRDSSRRAR